jgi:hypothetical protein
LRGSHGFFTAFVGVLEGDSEEKFVTSDDPVLSLDMGV